MSGFIHEAPVETDRVLLLLELGLERVRSSWIPGIYRLHSILQGKDLFCAMGAIEVDEGLIADCDADTAYITRIHAERELYGALPAWYRRTWAAYIRDRHIAITFFNDHGPFRQRRVIRMYERAVRARSAQLSSVSL